MAPVSSPDLDYNCWFEGAGYGLFLLAGGSGYGLLALSVLVVGCMVICLPSDHPFIIMFFHNIPSVLIY